MARGGKKKVEGTPRDPTRTMFLALNMILLAFFILLVALSNVNETKEAEIAFNVKRAFQSFGGSFLGVGTNAEAPGIRDELSLLEDAQKVEAFLGVLNRFVDTNEEKKAITYEIKSRGLIIHISEDFLFEEGTAEITEDKLPLLNGIFSLVLRTTNPVQIEGHTDDREIKNARYRDSWELSTARAIAVYRMFASSGQVPEGRFSVVGYGSVRPLNSNLTDEGRRTNRRVTIIFEGKLETIPGY